MSFGMPSLIMVCERRYFIFHRINDRMGAIKVPGSTKGHISNCDIIAKGICKKIWGK